MAAVVVNGGAGSPAIGADAEKAACCQGDQLWMLVCDRGVGCCVQFSMVYIHIMGRNSG